MVIGSAIGDEVGIQSDPVQPRVLVAPVDADPVGNQFGVQRGAHGCRQLLNAGNLQQQQVQNNLDFGYQQYQDAQNTPYKKLQTIGGVVGQAQGSTSTTNGGGK